MVFSIFRLGISMLLGVLSACTINPAVVVILSICILVCSVIIFLIKRKIYVELLIYVLGFFVAAASYFYAVSSYAHPTLHYIDRYVTLRGEITNPPQESYSSDNLRYTLRLDTIENRYGVRHTRETIALTTPITLRTGDRVTLRGIINDFTGQLNENGFDQDKYYKSRNIFTRIYTEDIEITENKLSPFSIGGRVMEIADSVIYKHYQGDGAAILSAIITGNKSHFSKEYDEVVRRTAFSRILHPAYIHIWVIMTSLACFSFILHRRTLDTMTIIILTLYSMTQCGNYGFVRCLVCTAIMLALRLRFHFAHYATTLASFFVLLIMVFPTMVFNASIILSATGGVLASAFASPIARRLTFVPFKLRIPLAITLIGAVLYTPFSMYYFNGICIYSLLLPFLIAPVMMAILVLAPLGLLLMELFGGGFIVEGYMKLIVDFLYKLPFWIAKLPFSSINLNTPSIAELVAYGLALYVAFLAIRKDGRHMFIPSALALGFSVAAILVPIVNMGEVKLSFVNVGQGDGAVIHRPYAETIVIDGGGSYLGSSYNIGEAVFVPYLESHGINHIEAAIVSHYHSDHAEGIVALLQSIKTDVVIMPKIRDYYDPETFRWAQVIWATAVEKGVKVHFVDSDTRVTFKSGLTLDIYAPPKDLGRMDENDTSLAVNLRYGDFSALFMGDLTQAGEKSLISRHNLDCHILKVAHHGSKDSSCNEFIASVTPEVSVISVGENNIYSHPHPDTLDRLSHTTILRTDHCRDIQISARKSGNYRILNKEP